MNSYKTNLALSYFEAWSRQDIDKLAEMFAEDILLRDWEISKKGKREVLEANQKIFDSVEDIVAVPLMLYECSARIMAAELKIIVNKKEEILVIDMIEFDDWPSKKINAIKAYKGS